MTEREDLVLLGRPAPDLAFQDRLLADRAQPLAVDHAYAALVPADRFAQEVGQQLAGFIDAGSVQIELALHDPVRAAQLADHVERDTFTTP